MIDTPQEFETLEEIKIRLKDHYEEHLLNAYLVAVWKSVPDYRGNASLDAYQTQRIFDALRQELFCKPYKYKLDGQTHDFWADYDCYPWEAELNTKEGKDWVNRLAHVAVELPLFVEYDPDIKIYYERVKNEVKRNVFGTSQSLAAYGDTFDKMWRESTLRYNLLEAARK
jgi:hypothetical protein